MSNPSLLIARTGRTAEDDSLYILSSSDKGMDFQEELPSGGLDGYTPTDNKLGYGETEFLNKTKNKTTRTTSFGNKLYTSLYDGEEYTDEFGDDEDIITYFPPQGGKSFGHGDDGKKNFSSGVVGLLGNHKQERILQIKSSGQSGSHTVYALPGRAVSDTGSKYLWIFSNSINSDPNGKFFVDGDEQYLSDIVASLSKDDAKDVFYAVVTNCYVFIPPWVEQSFRDKDINPIAVRFSVSPDKMRDTIEATLAEVVSDTSSSCDSENFLRSFASASHGRISAVQATKVKRKKTKKKEPPKQASLFDECLFGEEMEDLV